MTAVATVTLQLLTTSFSNLLRREHSEAREQLGSHTMDPVSSITRGLRCSAATQSCRLSLQRQFGVNAA